jgi:hypothetical protein
VKKAERAVEDAWTYGPRTQTIDSSEAKAWQANRTCGRWGHPLEKAKQLARATARDDYRARLQREKEETAAAHVELPAHITRLASGERRNSAMTYQQHRGELLALAHKFTEARDKLKALLKDSNAADPRTRKFIEDALAPVINECRASIEFGTVVDLLSRC